MPRSIPVADRLQAGLTVRDDGCHEWGKSVTFLGYGQIWHQGKNCSTHKIAWQLAFGEIPEGFQVNHTCDNRRCCNPEHLYLGSQAQNVADAMARQRHVHGTSVGTSVLTDGQVAAILKDQRKLVIIAREYGVNPSTISLIKRRKTWKHIKA